MSFIQRSVPHIVATRTTTTDAGHGRLNLRCVRVHARTYMERKERAAQLRGGTRRGRKSARRSKGGRDARRDVRNTGRTTCSRLATPRSFVFHWHLLHRIDSSRRRCARTLSTITPLRAIPLREILRRRSRPVVQGEDKCRACAVRASSR